MKYEYSMKYADYIRANMT